MGRGAAAPAAVSDRSPPSAELELMDRPDLPVADAQRALDDIETVHRWVGLRALWRALDPLLAAAPSPATLLDVGTGGGGVAARVARRAGARGLATRVLGIDLHLRHLVIGRRRHPDQLRVAADARALPLRDGAVDVAVSTLFQHHFDDRDGGRVVDEMRRVSSVGVAISDLRRSSLGSLLGGVVLRLLPLGAVARSDGRTSLRRAWSVDRFARVAAGGIVELRRRWPFRWAATLRPADDRPSSGASSHGGRRGDPPPEHGRALGLPAGAWIIGHRGAAGEAPENTLDSLRLAVEQGADMVELDLQLTADHRLVLAHDWDLERMAGRDLVVERATLDQLAAAEVSGRFRRPGDSRRIATLEQALDELSDATPLNLELKRRAAPIDALVAALAAAIIDHRRLVVSSFDWALLAAVRQALPTVPLAPIGGRSVDPGALLRAAEELDAWSVHCRHTVADDGMIAAAGDGGRPLLVYTVNEAGRAAELLARGVRGIFTDFPGRLRRELEGHR